MNPGPFTLDLGDGTRCTARIDLARLAPLTPQSPPSVVAIQWEGRRRDADFKPYREWIAGVWQQVADAANQPVFVLLPSPRQVYSIACPPHGSPLVFPLAYRP